MYISPNPALGTPSPWHRDNPALPPCVPHPGTAPVPLPPDTHLLVQTFSSTATPQLLSQWERGALLPHIKAGSSAEPNPPHSIPATGCSVCQPHAPAPPGDTASLARGHNIPGRGHHQPPAAALRCQRCLHSREALELPLELPPCSYSPTSPQGTSSWHPVASTVPGAPAGAGGFEPQIAATAL